jgi:spore maturation protein CgeB
MTQPLEIAFFGSSLVSAYWNGAATYYRGVIKALAGRGHRVTFYEPDAFERQQNRDIPDPDWAKVVVYEPDSIDGIRQLVCQAGGADILIKASGVGVHDALLEELVLELSGPDTKVIFWDVDAPATLERLILNPDDPFHRLVPQYDMILTYGGGDPVKQAYHHLGARSCHPIYNALDPDTHYPVAHDVRFECDLAFLGNRLPDREDRVDEFFLDVAGDQPRSTFLLAGSGWSNKPLSPNVKYMGHLPTAEHNAFNSSPRAILNISRDSMARFGFSPATRVFEAAGAGACIITDYWEGIDQFLKPGVEVLVARNHQEVIELIRDLSDQRAAEIGRAARRRVLGEHTYANRVEQLEKLLVSRPHLVTTANS